MYLALAVIAGATLLQLVPLSTETLAQLSPSTGAFLQQDTLRSGLSLSVQGEQVLEATQLGSRSSFGHPLSVQPGSTWVGLALLLAFLIFLAGCTRALSLTGAARLTGWLVVLGGLVALIGIIQKATSGGKIYGFWEPVNSGNPFGPFVNKNHFAGWMMMTLSLGLGYLGAGIARGLRGVKPGWRNRLLWFSSRSAGRLVLAALAVLLMGLSLVLTMSRSGITCFAIALLLFGWLAARKQAAGSRRVLSAGYLAFVLFMTLGWVGVDVVGQRLPPLPGPTWEAASVCGRTRRESSKTFGRRARD